MDAPRTKEQKKRVKKVPGPAPKRYGEYKNVKERAKIARVVDKEKDKEKKAKQKAKQTIVRAEKRVVQLDRQLYNAKQTAKNKKKALLEVRDIIKGKSAVLTEETLSRVPKAVREYVIEGEKKLITPNPGPQTMFLASSEKEVFFGGARGGGKSWAMLLDPLRYCDKPTASALIIRKTMPELRDLIEESRKIYNTAYPKARFMIQEKEWRFPSGARIKFGYCDSEDDVTQYQGHSYTWIGVDELPQYPSPKIWEELKGALRSTDPEIPIFMRATGNPGSVGSQWVKEMFIDPAPEGQTFRIEVDTMLGTRYITKKFIKSKLTDNPKLLETDEYLIMLSNLPEYRRRQWLDGDWDVYDGAAFSEFNSHIHVVEPFKIPPGWPRFRAADWGYSSPACCLWFASDREGNLWVYRELYTSKLTADIFAKKVLFMEKEDRVRYGVLDASAWANRGDVGPSIAETMIRNGCSWRPSDRSRNSRINGKLEVHRRLSVDLEKEEPRIKIFNNCRNLIRTLPQLPLDKNNQEDVDTDAEDHAYDALRYGCMSRPINQQQYEDMLVAVDSEAWKPSDRVFGY